MQELRLQYTAAVVCELACQQSCDMHKACSNDVLLCLHLLLLFFFLMKYPLSLDVTCRGSSGGGASQERVTFKHLTKSPADMPSPDAKPEYHNAICTVANIDPQQNMYYQACPDNNRKVMMCLALAPRSKCCPSRS